MPGHSGRCVCQKRTHLSLVLTELPALVPRLWTLNPDPWIPALNRVGRLALLLAGRVCMSERCGNTDPVQLDGPICFCIHRGLTFLVWSIVLCWTYGGNGRHVLLNECRRSRMWQAFASDVRHADVFEQGWHLCVLS